MDRTGFKEWTESRKPDPYILCRREGCIKFVCHCNVNDVSVRSIGDTSSCNYISHINSKLRTCPVSGRPTDVDLSGYRFCHLPTRVYKILNGFCGVYGKCDSNSCVESFAYLPYNNLCRQNEEVQAKAKMDYINDDIIKKV